MGSRSRALFLDLLDDLSSHLDAETLDLLRSGVDVSPWPDITLQEFRSLALAKSFYKKFIDMTEESANEKALEKFLSVNKTSGDWCYKPVDSWDEVLWGELKRSVHDFWNPEGMPLFSSFSELFTRGRCGPGASVGSQFSDFYSKLFSSRLSSTSRGIYRAYRCYIRDFPEWSIAELIRLDQYGEPGIVEGNRLQFVPKTRSIARTICIEPVMNMFLQLGVGSYLEERLERFFGISLATQPDINRSLVKIGSARGNYCSIDLESASDSIALGMLKDILPGDFLSWLDVLRSPYCELPDGSRVKLNMVSTMGNGFTFPLQTMLFACAVTAAARARGFHLGRPRAASEGSWGVFGDDIIVPMHAHYYPIKGIPSFEDFSDVLSRDVLRLLRLMGFTVNSSKSFFEGPFRESCGADYFSGQPVRGVYIKTLLTSQSRFVAINLLNRWSSVTGIPLTRTVKALRRSVPDYLVPIWESDDAGIKVPFSLVKKRKLDRNVQSILYRKFVVKGQSFKIGENMVLGKRVPIYNPSGLLLSFLNGTIRSCKIGVRSNTKLYRGCYAIAPNWDSDGTVSANADGQRWKTAVTRNLNI
jgi:hypothetical protein